MADNGLDKYLENIGINMKEEEETALPETAEPEQAPEPQAPTVVSLQAPAPLEGSPTERAETFLVNLLINFDPTYAVEIAREEEGEIHVDIFGGDSGKIIGRNGRTLQALEYIANTVLNRDADSRRVTIDVGGYKRRRDDRLRDTARNAAERVRESGKAYTLKPMSAAERRVIHMELADDPSVMSESTGEGRERRVVVKPS